MAYEGEMSTLPMLLLEYGRPLPLHYDSVHLTCSKKLTGSQLSPPQKHLHVLNNKQLLQ